MTSEEFAQIYISSRSKELRVKTHDKWYQVTVYRNQLTNRLVRDLFGPLLNVGKAVLKLSSPHLEFHLIFDLMNSSYET